jgi:hypothetical protein
MDFILTIVKETNNFSRRHYTIFGILSIFTRDLGSGQISGLDLSGLLPNLTGLIEKVITIPRLNITLPT